MDAMSKLAVAVAALEIKPDGSWLTLRQQIRKAARRASSAKVDLLALPELAILQVLAPDLPLRQTEVPRRLEMFAEEYCALCRSLAKDHGITIVAGSHIERNRNVAAICAPDGGIIKVEKQVLTQWESSEWGLQAGDPVESCPLVAICYECEFPELIRPRTLQGARIVVVPSFTETLYGFNRVRLSCHARAIESQVFVLHAGLVGSLVQEPVPSTWGSSAVIAPCCPPFSANGVLAATRFNRSGMAIATLDMDALHEARTTGDVRNFEDSCQLVRRLGANPQKDER